MSQDKRTRIVILGGGFGGVYTAVQLEKTLARDPDVEVILVNRDNFFLFTPMLHEVAASDLDITHIVNPVHRLLRRVHFFAGEAEHIDLSAKRVVLAHGLHRHTHELTYDHLVIGLGAITNFYNLPGLQEHALTMKSLGDAMRLRNRLIALLEEANSECAAHMRQPLLTFVVAGGGFAGVETIAGINDFVHEALRFYPHLTTAHLCMVLVHPGDVILPELSPKLGRYAQHKLAARGIDIRVNTKVTGMSEQEVALSDGTRIATHADGNARLPSRPLGNWRRLVAAHGERLEPLAAVWGTECHPLREGQHQRRDRRLRHRGVRPYHRHDVRNAFTELSGLCGVFEH